jgi:SAM-dependent methyltransferase
MPVRKNDLVIGRYNKQQREYFESTTKRTMMPSDTPYVKRHADELLRFGGIAPGNRVLEVGCGMGRYTLHLARWGVKVEGLDLSPVLLDRLRSFDDGLYNIPLHCADLLAHPPELKGEFDAVIGFFTLHHLHDLSRSLGAMSELVKPGGCVVFLEPNPFNPLYYFQILFSPNMTWQGDGGIVRIRPKPVFCAMEAAGLGRIATKRFGFFPPFLANRAWGAHVERALEGVPLWRVLLPFQLFRGTRV